jgi:hypothetical protein
MNTKSKLPAEHEDDDGAMIGGCDNDVDTIRNPTDVARDFVQLISLKWPNAYAVLVNDDTSETQELLTAELLRIELPTRGILSIVRDREMERHLEETGGTPMDDGEGPLTLWFRPLNAQMHYRFDLVTPALPTENAFSKWAVDQLLVAASEPQTSTRITPDN